MHCIVLHCDAHGIWCDGGAHGGERGGGGEVAEAHRLHELQVGQHRRARLRVAEDGALGDLAQQQLHDCAELVHGEPEAERLGGGRLALRLQQAAVRLGVGKLQRLDAALVVEVARELRVARLRGARAEARRGGSGKARRGR